MDAIVYGKGGRAGGNLVQGSNIFYGGSGGGGSGSSVSSVPVNTSTSFKFAHEFVSAGNSNPGGILTVSSTALTNYRLTAGYNGGDGSAPVGSAGGLGGAGAGSYSPNITFPFYTFGAGTNGWQGGSQAYPIALVDPSRLPQGIGIPSVAGGNEGDYGAGQLFSGVSGFAPSAHFDSPVCIITWYLKPS